MDSRISRGTMKDVGRISRREGWGISCMNYSEELIFHLILKKKKRCCLGKEDLQEERVPGTEIQR